MEQLPLYQQIANTLKSKILAGELRSGDQLPTEAEISKDHQVSRITSKRALTELENEGLIYRVQGKGSFVSPVQPSVRSGGRSETARKDILLILPFAHNPGLGDYEKGINEYLAGTEYTLNIQSNTIAGQRKLLEHALLGSRSGLILYPVDSISDLGILYRHYLSGYPVVTMDKAIEGIPFPAVVSDNYNGGYQAARHLIENNHKRIAFISSSRIESSTSIRERYFGYLKALHDAGLFDHGWSDDVGRNLSVEGDNGKDACKRFIQSAMDQGITGIVAENDLIAIELIQAAKELGLSVPEHFSIVGFDNIQLAGLIEPKLTTVSQDFGRMGYLAAQTLIGLMENGSGSDADPPNPKEHVVVPVRLIKRQTVRKL